MKLSGAMLVVMAGYFIFCAFRGAIDPGVALGLCLIGLGVSAADRRR